MTISIEDLPLSNRAKNVLWRHDYLTLDDLLTAQDNELLRCVGLGTKSLKEIRDLVAKYKEKAND